MNIRPADPTLSLAVTTTVASVAAVEHRRWSRRDVPASIAPPSPRPTVLDRIVDLNLGEAMIVYGREPIGLIARAEKRFPGRWAYTRKSTDSWVVERTA